MTSLDDLRSTLDRRAEGLDDTERYVRPVAVHARIRAVRRRRAATAIVAAVLVVIGAAAGVESWRTPDQVQPAGRTVLGIDVPATIDVTAFPYDLAGTHDLTDSGLHLDAAPHDQAVQLVATGLGSGSATLFVDDEPVARVRGDEQTALPVPLADGAADVRVRFDGTPDTARAGIALYEATDELAPGISNGTAVFRDEVAGHRLIAAVFSQPGASSAEMSAPGRLDQARFAFYCTATDDNLWVNLDIDGSPGTSSSCGGSGRDAAIGTSTTELRVDSSPVHSVRVYLTRGSDGPEVSPAGVVFGAGVYERDTIETRVLGITVETTVEYEGRTWTLDDVLDSPATIDTADGDRLLAYVARGRKATLSWSGRLVPDQVTSMGSASGGVSSSQAGLLLAGDRYTVRLAGTGQIVVYRPE